MVNKKYLLLGGIAIGVLAMIGIVYASGEEPPIQDLDISDVGVYVI